MNKINVFIANNLRDWFCSFPLSQSWSNDLRDWFCSFPLSQSWSNDFNRRGHTFALKMKCIQTKTYFNNYPEILSSSVDVVCRLLKSFRLELLTSIFSLLIISSYD